MNTSSTIAPAPGRFVRGLWGVLSVILSLIRRDALVLTCYILLALMAMAPVLGDPRHMVLGEPADNVHYVYMVGWTAQSLLLGESPFSDPRLNYPDDLNLATNDSPYLFFLLVAPVTLVLGPVAGYNMVIFLSYVLSGYFTYLWVRRLTGSPFAAAFAGTAFMLSPFHVLRSQGHANIVSTQMIPLFFWSLDRCVSTKTTREAQLWLLGLATFALAGSSQYLLVICLATGALYALYALLPDIQFIVVRGWRIALSVLLGALIGALPSISALGGGGFEPYNIGRTRIWSADPINFILPSSLHPLWGAFINTLRPEPYAGEKTLYVGAVALVLAVIGIVALGRGEQRRRAIVWALTALSAAIFALGTDLWLNNQPLSESSPLWLPAYYLAKLPLINIMRVWSRFGIVTIFFVAMLAGYGAHAITQPLRARWLRVVAPLLLLAALLVDLLPGTLPASTLAPREVERWLAQQPGDLAVAFLPVDKPLINDLAIFGSLFHGKQMPAYIHLVHAPRAYKDFVEMALEFPSDDSVHFMQRRGLSYLILEKAQYNGWRAPQWAEIERRLQAYPELSIVRDVDGYVVLAMH